MRIEQEGVRIVPKLSSSTRGPLASLVSEYGLWAGTAATAGVFSELFFPIDGPIDVPMPVLLAALFGLGIWLADVTRRNRHGHGWIANAMLGVLLSAVIFKWSCLLTIVAEGKFEHLEAALTGSY